MESLNMSKLNLSSVRRHKAVIKVQKTDAKLECNLAVSDVDGNDLCEYREDIWKNLLQQESERTPIHMQSPQLEFRGTLVQQLRDITTKLELTMATLHAAVALLDLFMDAHRLRSDRLTHVALACLSLTAKSEEKFSRAPTLKTLAKMSGVQLCGKTFRQLEWMVGQHARWRLLTPTAVTFAALIAQHVVADCDLTTRQIKFVRRFRRDGAKLLDAYLDLTLSDVRLKVVDTVDVGCACVACARADLGLPAWPPWLADATSRDAKKVVPVARLLIRMMQVMKRRETLEENSEVDQGYGSARTSPCLTPTTSPQSTASPDTSYVNTCRESQVSDVSYSVLDLSDTQVPAPDTAYFALPQDCEDLNEPNDFRYNRSRRLLEASIQVQPLLTSLAVKRKIVNNSIEVDMKKMRERARIW